MKTFINRLPDGFYALLLFTILFLFAFTVTRAQGNLILKGTLMHPEENTARPYAEIIASNGEHMPLVIRPNGRFWVCAPANDRYIVRFTQAGCVPKEVMIDARHATSASAHNDRKFAFDVVLNEDDGEQAMRFSSPVGRVEFHSSTGHAHVTHHYDLVPVSQLLAQDAPGEK